MPRTSGPARPPERPWIMPPQRLLMPGYADNAEIRAGEHSYAGQLCAGAEGHVGDRVQ